MSCPSCRPPRRFGGLLGISTALLIVGSPTNCVQARSLRRSSSSSIENLADEGLVRFDVNNSSNGRRVVKATDEGFEVVSTPMKHDPFIPSSPTVEWHSHSRSTQQQDEEVESVEESKPQKYNQDESLILVSKIHHMPWFYNVKLRSYHEAMLI